MFALVEKNAAKKKKTRSFLIGLLGHLCEIFELLLRRLEPAIDRTAVNSDPFGKRLDTPTLLQVNLNHLFALCGQVKLDRAWNATGINKVQFRNILQGFRCNDR